MDEAALRHGAAVEHETTKGSEAYARFPPDKPTRCRDGWLPTSELVAPVKDRDIRSRPQVPARLSRARNRRLLKINEQIGEGLDRIVLQLGADPVLAKPGSLK